MSTVKWLPLLFMLIASQANAQRVAVSFTRESIVYAGVPNPLTVIAEKIPPEQIVVTTDNGTIRASDEASHFDFMPAHAGIAHITVSRSTISGMHVLEVFTDKVLKIPGPVMRLAGRRKGTISRAQLCVQIAPSAVLEGFEFDAKFVISEFHVMVSEYGQVILEKTLHDNAGTRFDEATRNVFCKLHSGAIVILSHFEYRGPNGKSERCNDEVVLTIE